MEVSCISSSQGINIPLQLQKEACLQSLTSIDEIEKSNRSSKAPGIEEQDEGAHALVGNTIEVQQAVQRRAHDRRAARQPGLTWDAGVIRQSEVAALRQRNQVLCAVLMKALAGCLRCACLRRLTYEEILQLSRQLHIRAFHGVNRPVCTLPSVFTCSATDYSASFQTGLQAEKHLQEAYSAPIAFACQAGR